MLSKIHYNFKNVIKFLRKLVVDEITSLLNLFYELNVNYDFHCLHPKMALCSGSL